MNNKTLSIDNSLLLIIDMQDKLLSAQTNREKIQKNTAVLAKAAQILGIPVVVSEQYPQGLGGTTLEIRRNLTDNTRYYEKKSFSCCINSGFEVLIQSSAKKNIITCGIESHICVYQTVRDLIKQNYNVFIVKDAISSRKEFERNIGFERMTSEGAIPVCTEMVLFELMKCSSHESFKQIQALIK